ncbi:hypothetical protein K7G90_000066 [Pasteurella canis]|uniref:hypothetical protein n=1 Tax=Pasteurella canis TaxID=753 RepID=UPI001CC7A637|nr:hypothetical protein [Pasteurella canis]UAY77834.1 hypothetical protein K7G90_000066 [Pasteurella canis]
MRSFLLEYTERAQQELKGDATIDLHINLWGVNAQSSEKSPKMVLDFGFMIDDITKIKEIILYCPFNVEKVEDLGRLLSVNPDLIDAIFNEDCETLSNIHPNRVKITKKGDNFKKQDNSKDEFILYKLDSSLIDFKDENGYSRIRINVADILSGKEAKIEHLNNTKKYYIRIRISPNDDELSYILKRENEEINILQDVSLKTTEIIDFRINDFRSITEKMKEEAYRLNKFKISSVHYFIMRSSTDEYIASADTYKSRLLENEVWNKYISLSENDVIAYHFKKDKDKNISSFTNLSRFKYPLNVKERIFCYIGIVIMISILSSMIASFFIQ